MLLAVEDEALAHALGYRSDGVILARSAGVTVPAGTRVPGPSWSSVQDSCAVRRSHGGNGLAEGVTLSGAARPRSLAFGPASNRHRWTRDQGRPLQLAVQRPESA